MNGMDSKAEILAAMAARLNEAAGLRAKTSANAKSARKRVVLRQWQSERLAATHADLMADARYHAAAQFFLDELYGTKDTARRDADVARVVPTLSKFLPASGLEIVADAVELDALSEFLDAAMIAALGPRIDALDAASYGAAYRAVGRRDQREHQLDLIADLGRALDQLTRKAFAGTALKMMRKPAELAGFGELQAFLETGYDAFRLMKGADAFLDRIVTRERAVLSGLFAGNDAVLAPGYRFTR